ncbi:hypothetical protein TNCV_562741 [Trichonephila clavipes]|nr:hypothetical protein TNCV_562741 [Trichonephila clavipes]
MVPVLKHYHRNYHTSLASDSKVVWTTVENTTRTSLAHVVGNLNSDSFISYDRQVGSPSRSQRRHRE